MKKIEAIYGFETVYSLMYRLFLCGSEEAKHQLFPRAAADFHYKISPRTNSDIRDTFLYEGKKICDLVKYICQS